MISDPLLRCAWQSAPKVKLAYFVYWAVAGARVSFMKDVCFRIHASFQTRRQKWREISYFYSFYSFAAGWIHKAIPLRFEKLFGSSSREIKEDFEKRGLNDFQNYFSLRYLSYLSTWCVMWWCDEHDKIFATKVWRIVYFAFFFKTVKRASSQTISLRCNLERKYEVEANGKLKFFVLILTRELLIQKLNPFVLLNLVIASACVIH